VRFPRASPAALPVLSVQNGFNDFRKAFAAFAVCEIGGKVLHLFQEAVDVLHACGMGEVSEHGLIIGGVAAEKEALSCLVKVKAPPFLREGFGHAQFGVIAEPPVHMDGGNLAGCTVLLEDGADTLHLLP
jgi:hypothetical protein